MNPLIEMFEYTAPYLGNYTNKINFAYALDKYFHLFPELALFKSGAAVQTIVLYIIAGSYRYKLVGSHIDLNDYRLILAPSRWVVFPFSGITAQQAVLILNTINEFGENYTRLNAKNNSPSVWSVDQLSVILLQRHYALVRINTCHSHVGLTFMLRDISQTGRKKRVYIECLMPNTELLHFLRVGYKL